MLVPAPAPKSDSRQSLRIAGVLGFLISITFWVSDLFGPYEMMWMIRGWLLLCMLFSLYQAWAARQFQADPRLLERRLKAFAAKAGDRHEGPIQLELADPVWWRGYQVVWNGSGAYLSPRAVAELDDDELRWLIAFGRALKECGFQRQSLAVTLGACGVGLAFMLAAVLSDPLSLTPWLTSLGVWAATLLSVHVWQRIRYRTWASKAATVATAETGFKPTTRLLNGPIGRWQLQGPWEGYQSTAIKPSPRARPEPK